MSGAIESLMRQYPGRFRIGVDTSCDAIYWHNPHVTLKKDHAGARVIEMQYPLIHRTHEPYHFLHGFTLFLGEQLGLPLKLVVNRPYLYFSFDEGFKPPRVQKPYVVLNAGWKNDFQTKRYPVDYWQAVVDHFRGTYPGLTWVQVGEGGHNHPAVNGCLDLRGSTTSRELLHLCQHSVGGLGGESLNHHVYGALQKPYVCVASGMLTPRWVHYDTAKILSSMGQISCAAHGSCWRTHFNDDPQKGCMQPVNHGEAPIPYGKCMLMVKPSHVIDALQGYIDGGTIRL